MTKIKLSENFIKNTVKLALNEDLYPSGDITSDLIKNNKIVEVKLISNENAIIGGLQFAKHAFALIDDKMPVVVIVTAKGYDKILSNIEEVKSRGGKIITISTEETDGLKSLSDHFIYLENASSVHNSITPILTSVPLQLLAYHIAVLKGCNVDQPRNLAKSVTVE